VVNSKGVKYRTAPDVTTPALDYPPHASPGDIVMGYFLSIPLTTKSESDSDRVVRHMEWLEVDIGRMKYYLLIKDISSIQTDEEGEEEVVNMAKSRVSINPPFNRAGCLESFIKHVPWCVSNCGRTAQIAMLHQE
jgi:hypothetical protein